MPELQVLNGSLQWKTIPVSGERFLIGRKENCHLALRDGWVSREHTLIIEPKTGEFRVQDLDSENGTFLNGERIRDAVLKHGDVLRVGRTEMRFAQHSGSTPAFAFPRSGAEGATAEEAGVRTGASSQAADPVNQTIKVDLGGVTAIDGSPRADGPRIDLRERVRRLEEQLLDGEQANAALAAENAVLKRALARLGVLDRDTGAIDAGKLSASSRKGRVPDAMRRFVTNPLARIAFPGLDPAAGARAQGHSNPGLFDLGLIGVDALGIRFAECVSRLGYRRTVAVTAERDAMRGGVVEPAWRIYVDRPPGGRSGVGRGHEHVLVPAMPRIEEACAEAFGGSDRVLLCAAASAPLATEGLSVLADLVTRSGGRPGLVLFFDPEDDLVDSRERANRTLAAARSLSESGRCAPCIVVDLDRARRLAGGASGGDAEVAMLDSIAGALDALLRLPMVPALDSEIEPKTVASLWSAKGWSTLGLAATPDTSRASIEGAFSRALSTGLLAQTMPPSRARSAAVFTIVGAGESGDVDVDVESGRSVVAKLLPQAHRIESTYQDAGDAVRVIAWIGGLPFPESFLKERELGA